jgi:hypothetical protein
MDMLQALIVPPTKVHGDGGHLGPHFRPNGRLVLPYPNHLTNLDKLGLKVLVRLEETTELVDHLVRFVGKFAYDRQRRNEARDHLKILVVGLGDLDLGPTEEPGTGDHGVHIVDHIHIHGIGSEFGQEGIPIRMPVGVLVVNQGTVFEKEGMARF